MWNNTTQLKKTKTKQNCVRMCRIITTKLKELHQDMWDNTTQPKKQKQNYQDVQKFYKAKRTMWNNNHTAKKNISKSSMSGCIE